MNRTINEDDVIRAVNAHTIATKHGLILSGDITIILEGVPTVNEEKWAQEIREAYARALKNPYIRKPLSRALYEVWHRYDQTEVERR